MYSTIINRKNIPNLVVIKPYKTHDELNTNLHSCKIENNVILMENLCTACEKCKITKTMCNGCDDKCALCEHVFLNQEILKISKLDDTIHLNLILSELCLHMGPSVRKENMTSYSIEIGHVDHEHDDLYVKNTCLMIDVFHYDCEREEVLFLNYMDETWVLDMA